MLFAVGGNVPVLIAFAILFGVANGLVTIVRGGLIPEYFGRSHIGRISGAMAAVAMVARAAGPWAAALVLVAVGDYLSVMLLLAGLGTLAAVSFWSARPADPASVADRVRDTV
jgi:MFS family permease